MSQTRSQKRSATDSPAPATSEEPTDTHMVDYDLLTEKILARLAQRMDASDKTRNEQFAQLKQQFTQLQADYGRQQSKIEELQNKIVILETANQRRDQLARSNNAMLFNIPEEGNGARVIDTVKKVLETLPADGSRVETPVACVRIGAPREGAAAKPRPIKAIFASTDAKHGLLKRGKDLRAKGFGVDVDLTPQQRAERTSKSDRFTALKAQGHKPFFRGSILMVRQGDRIWEDRGNLPPPPPGNPPPPPPGNPPTYAQAASRSAPHPGAAE